MTGLDAGFLYMETPSLHMHTLKLAVLELPPDAPELPVEWVRAQIAARLHLLPPFRRRIVEVPLGLHHPVWIEDPDFDIARHVRKVSLPAPGDRRQLERTVAVEAGRPLDRSRPLWEMCVIDGLADGRLAVLVKIHHAAADGVAASRLLMNVMDERPDAPAPGPDAWRPEPRPTAWRLVCDALVDRFRELRDLPALARRTTAGVRALARRRRLALHRPPRPMLDAPRTPFNGALVPARTFGVDAVSLEAVKEIKDAFSVSVNDVVLAAVSGSLRRYLLDRGALPERSLIAGVPVATDDPLVVRLGGNRVSNLFTSLATDLDDPVARLFRIHAVTAEAKVGHGLLGGELLAEWSAFTPPRPYAWVVRWWSRHRVAERLPPPINAVVSNVPGPRVPLYAGGARLVELYSVGPVLEGIGCNVTVWSYLDQLFVAVISCPTAIADAAEIATGVRVALEEYLTLVPSTTRAGRARS